MSEEDDDWDWEVPADQRPPGVARMVRTCLACPTQYDLWLEDGRYLYFRYRHSRWRLELYPTQASFWGGEPLAYAWGDLTETEGEDQGVLEHAEVLALIAPDLPTLANHPFGG